jgi:hypothetical protein
VAGRVGPRKILIREIWKRYKKNKVEFAMCVKKRRSSVSVKNMENEKKDQAFSSKEGMNTFKKEAILIRFEDDTVTECRSAIIIPESAITEAGYIRAMTTNANAHSKHEFHAMAQIAFSQFQDGELDIETVHGPLMVESKNEVETIIAGLVVFLDSKGSFHLIAHSGQNAKKLLEVAHRFFTRWVRLDI